MNFANLWNAAHIHFLNSFLHYEFGMPGASSIISLFRCTFCKYSLHPGMPFPPGFSTPQRRTSLYTLYLYFSFVLALFPLCGVTLAVFCFCFRLHYIEVLFCHCHSHSHFLQLVFIVWFFSPYISFVFFACLWKLSFEKWLACWLAGWLAHTRADNAAALHTHKYLENYFHLCVLRLACYCRRTRAGGGRQ